jgi:N utilization substance protein A
MASQSDFLMAINQIAAERGIDMNEILEAIKTAIRTGFKKDYPEDEGLNLKVEISPDQGMISVFADKKVVKEVTNPATQISVEQAKKVEPKLREGDHVEIEITPQGDFGRVAAQAARQVILQQIREAEKESVLKQFKDKMGTVESVIIQRVDRDGNVIVEVNRATAIMPSEDRIPGEFYRSGTRIKVLLQRIQSDVKGKTLIVSRSAPEFLKALFALEVPEITSGTVEIMAIAREAGSRSKIAVKSNAEGVDPIGSCVGQRGVRINAVTNELKSGMQEEKIDIINWNADTSSFIANAIKPAEALEVKLVSEMNKQAMILVDDESLSLAIGKEGQNVRLAAKLTGWNLDIQGIHAYKEKHGDEAPVEEAKQEKEPKETKAKKTKTEAKAESTASDDLASLNLGTRVVTTLQKAGIETVSALREQIASTEPIKGVGEKTREQIVAALG